MTIDRFFLSDMLQGWEHAKQNYLGAQNSLSNQQKPQTPIHLELRKFKLQKRLKQQVKRVESGSSQIVRKFEVWYWAGGNQNSDIILHRYYLLHAHSIIYIMD